MAWPAKRITWGVGWSGWRRAKNEALAGGLCAKTWVQGYFDENKPKKRSKCTYDDNLFDRKTK